MRFLSPLRVLAVLSVAGCNLISADLTRITFDLPPRSYHFDASTWQFPAAGTLPSVACTADADCCAIPGFDCAMINLACDSGMCALHKTVTVVQTMNLGQEVSQLNGSDVLADVFINEISYEVASTLNVPLPPVTLYLAPMGVEDPAADGAKKFGTVPMTDARASKSGIVTLETDAQQTFADHAKAPETSFNFIASTDVVVTGGMPIPMGDVNFTVTGKVSVQPNL